MHAICLEALKLRRGEKFLEVGAGSGILLAYAYEIIKERNKVFGIEIVPEAYEFGKRNLEKTGYGDKVKIMLSDGSLGLHEYAPFDKILISAACPDIPKPLEEQLKVGGRMVAVVGPPYGDQNLVLVKKLKNKKFFRETLLPVVFVPLSGRYGWDKP
jgi:protein-L-isoaspartate(D-aspartate) O-methyltransferase